MKIKDSFLYSTIVSEIKKKLNVFPGIALANEKSKIFKDSTNPVFIIRIKDYCKYKFFSSMKHYF